MLQALTGAEEQELLTGFPALRVAEPGAIRTRTRSLKGEGHQLNELRNRHELFVIICAIRTSRAPPFQSIIEP